MRRALRLSLSSPAKKPSPSTPPAFGPWCPGMRFVSTPATPHRHYWLACLPTTSLQAFWEGGGGLISLSRGWHIAAGSCSQDSYQGNFPSLSLRFFKRHIGRLLGKGWSLSPLRAFQASASQESVSLLVTAQSYKGNQYSEFILSCVCVGHSSSGDCPRGCPWLSTLPDAGENLSL